MGGSRYLRPSRCHALRQALLLSSRSILSTGHTIILTAMTLRRRAGSLGSVTKPTAITYVVLLTTVSLSETALGVGRMGPPRWLRFVERPFPSANMVVIAGEEQVLVDTGYGSDLARTEGLLAESGIGLADLSLVVNTHHHSDHFASRPWAADFARHAFEADPREFARALIEELLRSGAARRRGGRLVASVPHNRPRPSGTPPIPGPETGRLLKRRRNGPMGTVARIVETTGKEKDEQARGPADQLFRWALRR